MKVTDLTFTVDGAATNIPITLCQIRSDKYMPGGKATIELYDGRVVKRATPPKYRLVIEIDYPAIYDDNLITSVNDLIGAASDPARTVVFDKAANPFVAYMSPPSVTMVIGDDYGISWDYDRLVYRVTSKVQLISSELLDSPVTFFAP